MTLFFFTPTYVAVSVKMVLGAQICGNERSDTEGTKEVLASMKNLLETERKAFEGLTEEVKLLVQRERKGLEEVKEEMVRQFDSCNKNEAEIKTMVEEIKEDLQHLKKPLPQCIVCMEELRFPKRIIQCCRGIFSLIKMLKLRTH